MRKRLMEIRALLQELTARSQGLTPLPETATDAEIEERAGILDGIEEEKRTLLEEKAEIEKKIRAAMNVQNHPEDADLYIPEDRSGRKQTNEEIRNSDAYIAAFAKYLKTGKDDECRALLTENVDGGSVPIPEFAENSIRTAWENDEILSRINRTFVKGNLKIGFEISGTEAAIHVEGTKGPNEEQLTLGIVTLTAQTVKKWIRVSSEVLAMKDRNFIQYIYDELGYRIAKKAADTIVYIISHLPTTATATSPAAAQLSAAVTQSTAINAFAMLSDEATDNVVILNKLTWAKFRSITTADGYLVNDPFDGMTPVFNNSLPSYDDATAGAVYMIVGDLRSGFQANFPDGDDIKFIFDEYTNAEDDLVKIVGRLYVALGAVAQGRFVNVTKPGSSPTPDPDPDDSQSSSESESTSTSESESESESDAQSESNP